MKVVFEGQAVDKKNQGGCATRGGIIATLGARGDKGGASVVWGGRATGGGKKCSVAHGDGEGVWGRSHWQGRASVVDQQINSMHVVTCSTLFWINKDLHEHIFFLQCYNFSPTSQKT